ncbi:response regulator [Trichocoleus sp. FACHB-591]|nr:response regulator [Trichocoleus sp. FACHB-591]
MQRNGMSEEPDIKSRLRGISILLVEDDPDTLAIFDLFLTHMGATVATATTVKAALKMAEEVQPDILISDLQLPDGNGYDLLDMIRKLPSSSSKLIPAILMTGHSTPFSEPAYNQGALSGGFQKFLAKLFNIDELLAAIAEFTRGVNQDAHVYCCDI